MNGEIIEVEVDTWIEKCWLRWDERIAYICTLHRFSRSGVGVDVLFTIFINIIIPIIINVNIRMIGVFAQASEF